MKLVNYFYSKFLLSFFICLGSCIVIFYIFSLLGNLGEDLSFSSIIYLSILNAFQIISFVPSFISLLTLIILVIILRSKNELMIIKEYLSIKKLFLVCLPIAIFFTFIEINKDIGSDKLEEMKSNFLKTNDELNIKVILNQKMDSKTYTIIKGLNISESKIDEYQMYKIKNGIIIGGEYSNQIQLNENNLKAKEIIIFNNNKIEILNYKNIFLKNLSKLNTNFFLSKYIDKDKLFIINLKDIIRILFFVFFFISIFLIIFNKNIIDRKSSYFYSFFICSLLFIYSLIIFNIEVSLFNKELNFLALIMIFLIFFKNLKYE